MKTKNIIIIAIASLLIPLFGAQASAATEAQRKADFSISKKGLALEGYDPVSYFEGGPKEGSKNISSTVKGITYYFTSEANKAKFDKDPSKYEPAYGGWCAWAMAEDGSKTEVDPETYKIVDGRLFVYYNGFFANTLKLWNEKAEKSGEAGLVKNADKNWDKILGS
ncbi:YHS domain-containing (seleno)protein [Rubellicoccus peritrichatus]|uniref:YHS domain-containing (Seleno)protein n=1 Tax=Rubellicoccus peritrichatus TaxID=3080537 RepID=A0AAQ3QX57_9BACT|nr:YHS domain-containing (seleno)protein [Puniceicoccus sp. CR14]WOO43338.1 YHS domain-containing (seleno)protein [Puniceicoccus sp. CR14]